MATELEYAWSRFREAVAVLALPPEEQRRVNGHGCLACDLLNDFDDARRLFLANFGDVLTAEQQTGIAVIDYHITGMSPVDLECFNDEVVHRPAWQLLRENAGE